MKPESDHPFTRTTVLITAMVSALVFILGIVAIVSFVPDSGPRITSVLTITVPVFLIALVNVAVSIRNGRIVSQTQDAVKTVQRHTNGINSTLLTAVVGGKTPTTEEIAIVAKEIATAIKNQEEGK